MIKVFHGENEDAHKAFQAWRKANPDGFHMTDKGGKVFSAHWTKDKREDFVRGRGCNHQGTSYVPWGNDREGCYTTAKKVCSTSFQELIEWAASQDAIVNNCSHCDTKKFPFPQIKVLGLLTETVAGIPKGNNAPTASTLTVMQYSRDESIRQWILKNSAGVCECCGNPSPFKGVDGELYLEVHHLHRLADGGPDTTMNTVAVCPNCHRHLHHGLDAPQVVNRLYAQISRLVRC